MESSDVGYSLFDLQWALGKVSRLSQLKIGDNAKIDVHDAHSSTHDPGQLHKIRSLFQRAATDTLSALQRPPLQASNYTWQEIDKESAAVLEQRHRLQFIKSLLSSPLAGEIFTTPDALERVKEETSRQDAALQQAVNRSLDHLEVYISGELSKDLAALDMRTVKQMGENFSRYPESPRSSVRELRQRLGEHYLKAFLRQQYADLLQPIEAMPIEDQKILYELALEMYLDKWTLPQIKSFIHKIGQINQIANTPLKQELKEWLFINNSHWGKIQWQDLVEFGTDVGLKTLQELFDETKNYSKYSSSAARFWLGALVSDTRGVAGQNRVEVIKNGLKRIREHYDKENIIPEPILGDHLESQLELLRLSGSLYKEVGHLYNCKRAVLLASRSDPNFARSFLAVRKMLDTGDISTRMSFEGLIESKFTIKECRDLAPFLQKLANSELSVVIACVQCCSTACYKFPPSYRGLLPALFTCLPEKLTFIQALNDALPMDPKALKNYFTAKGEQALYQSVFETSLDVLPLLQNHTAGAQSFSRWMAKQLMTSQDLPALLQKAPDITPDSLLFIKQLLQCVDQVPALLQLLDHNPPKESLQIILTHLGEYPKSSLVPFLLNHPALLAHVPKQLGLLGFDNSFAKMPLRMLAFIFKNAHEQMKFEDMLKAYNEDPEKMQMIVDIETALANPILWRPGSYKVYSEIDRRKVAIIHKNPELQKYLATRDKPLTWDDMPLDIFDVAPKLPVELLRVVENYTDVTDSFADKVLLAGVQLYSALAAVVSDPKSEHLATKVVAWEAQCREKRRKLSDALPPATFAAIFAICQKSGEKVASELFGLLLAKPEDPPLALSFLNDAPYKETLPDIVEAICRQYPSLQALPTIREKLLKLPMEWKCTLVDLMSGLQPEFVEKIRATPLLGATQALIRGEPARSKAAQDLPMGPIAELAKRDLDVAEALKFGSWVYFSEEAYSVGGKLYLECFKANPTHVVHRAFFSAKNANAIELIKKVDLTKVKSVERFYDQVLAMAQYGKIDALEAIVRAMVERGEYELGQKLLEMAKAGYVPEALALLQRPGDPLGQKLVANAGSTLAGEIQILIQLDRSNRALVDFLAEGNAFSKRQLIVCELLRQNKMDLVNAVVTKSASVKVLHCIDSQDFEIAELYLTKKTPFSDLKVAPELIIPLAHLMLDCQAAGSDLALQKALSAIQANKSPEEILLLIGTLQYLLVHGTDQIDLKAPLDEVRAATFENDEQKERALETAYSGYLAKMLTTRSGRINHALLATHTFASEFPAESEYALYLARVMKVLQTGYQASSQLSQTRLPQSSASPSSLILRKMLNLAPDAPLTDWHAQVGVLSALLSRPRQGPVGSCYGTQMAILLQSTAANLFQSIKDYQEIIAENAMTKAARGKKQGSYSYPLALPHQALKKQFPTDNLLLKARENLLSNMSGAGIFCILEKSLALFANDIEYGSAIEQYNFNYLAVQPPISFDTMLEVLKSAFNQKAKAVVQFETPHPVTRDLGHWALERRDKVAAIESAQDYIDLHLDMLQHAKSELAKRFSHHTAYLEHCFEVLQDFVVARLSKKIHSEYWSQPSGGRPEEVCAAYLQFKGTFLPQLLVMAPAPEDLLKALIQYIHNLPQGQKAATLIEPERVMPMTMPGHAICLKPYELLKRIDAGMDHEALFEQLKMPTPIKLDSLSDDERNTMMQTLTNGLPEALVEPFQSLISRTDWTKMGPEEFGSHFVATLKTVYGAELPDLMVRKLHRVLFTALPAAIQRKMPYLIVGDLNWNKTKHENFYLAIARSPITGALSFFRCNRYGADRGPLHWDISRGNWELNQPLSRVVQGHLTYE